MQLADHVGRKMQRSMGGREATAHAVVCSRQVASHCCLISTSHVSHLCEFSHAAALPELLTALPMTPNIYYQRQPCLTSNSRSFTECVSLYSMRDAFELRLVAPGDRVAATVIDERNRRLVKALRELGPASHPLGKEQHPAAAARCTGTSLIAICGRGADLIAKWGH